MYQLVKRLHNGDDLKAEIVKLAEKEKIPAGCIVSAVGSLTEANLRTVVKDGVPVFKKWVEHFEIVSITGTVSKYGHHIHISISNVKGETFGGHLSEGCLVSTVVELVILVFDDMEFKREFDESTGFKELKVVRRKE